MLWILCALTVAAILKAAATSDSPTPVKRAVSPATVGAELAQLDLTDPAAMMRAAHRVNDVGLPNTAKALASRALEVADVTKAVDEVVNAPIPSPIPNVTDEKWTEFVRLCRGEDIEEISPSYCLGLFNVGFVRLRELGLATEVRQSTYEGRTVWVGTLKPPMTLKRFLCKPVVQYRVFAKDMNDRAAMIRDKYPKLVGSDLEGCKASLSGLLAVAKLAGTKGFHGWATDPRQRAKFKHTTQAFKAANGIF